MMTTERPNFELLKDAYQIIGGIPERQFNLANISNGKTGEHYCKTLACAAGWLALHPLFQAKGLGTKNDGSLCLNDKYTWYDDAMMYMFSLSQRDAQALFGSRRMHEREEPFGSLSDKELWLKRVRDFLEERGQLSSQLAKKKK